MVKMNITRGPIRQTAIKVVIYGPEGIGKSTFASCFPDPVFIDTEDSTKYMDVCRMDKPTSWSSLLEEVRYIRDHPAGFKTLVIDTADWAEQLCIRHVINRDKKKSIEDWGYGKGYVMVSEEFGKLLNLLSEVTERNVNIVITAHARMRKFEQPDDGSYDRWEMKLSRQVGPMVKEWADMVLFANYKVMAIKAQGELKAKGRGGARVMYTTHNPCWDAKNRHGLPDELPFTFYSIANIIPTGELTVTAEPPVPETNQTLVSVGSGVPWPKEATAEELLSGTPEKPKPEKQAQANKQADTQADKQPQAQPKETGQAGEAYPGQYQQMDMNTPVPFEDDSCETIYGAAFIPEEIRDSDPPHIREILQLCNQAEIFSDEVCMACERKGMVPAGTDLRSYPDFFVRGNLIPNWEKIKTVIMDFRQEGKKG